MTERRIVKLLLALLLLTSLGLLVLIITTNDLGSPALQRIFGTPGRQTHAVQPPRPAQISAEKRPRTKEKPSSAETPRLEVRGRDAPALEVSVSIPPFPSSSDVRLGMSRIELTRRFGEPNATATWFEKGILHEKLLYRRLDKSAEIGIEGGRVASISSNKPVR